MALNLSDAVIDEIAYKISADDIETISGVFEVDVAPGSTFTAIIGGVPAGQDRLLTLNAITTDGVTCVGESAFDVSPGQTTAVHVVLNCGHDGGRGSVDVDVDINHCPQIASISAVPASASVGAQIRVGVGTSDGDLDAVSTEWTANDGAFADPSAPSTTYTCATAGTHTLQVKAMDAGCSDTVSVEVTCTSGGDGVCGDGMIDPGEACDDGNTADGDGCSADCEAEVSDPVCGDGMLDPGEACDDGNNVDGDGCSADCEFEVSDPVCGDGTVDDGEECDDGNTADGDGCSAECTVEAASANMVGTWITPQQVFETQVEAPVLGLQSFSVFLNLATRVDSSGNTTSQLCYLDLALADFAMQFVTPVTEIQTQDPVVLAEVSYPVGAPFPVSTFGLSGQDLVFDIAPILTGAVMDLEVTISVDGTFSAVDRVTGSTSFSSTGSIELANGTPFGDIVVPAPGAPAPSGPFELIKVSDDPGMSCSDALSALP